MSTDLIIRKDTDLYYEDFKTRKGITNDTINVTGECQNVYNNEEYIEVMLYGYTQLTNIYPNSLIEWEVEKLVKSDNIKYLYELINKFKLSECTIDRYKFLIYRELDWGYCAIRMLIFLNEQNKIIGIANRNRIINLKYIGKGKTENGFEYYYLLRLNELEKANLLNAIETLFRCEN